MNRDEIREKIFQSIWENTSSLVSRKITPKLYQNIFDQFDLNLVSGHKSELKDKSDFSTEFLEQIKGLQREAQNVAPQLSPIPIGKLHLTIFPLYLDKPNTFFTEGSPQKRHEDYKKVLKVFADGGPISLSFKGLNLCDDGTLIIQGFDSDNKIDPLRRLLNDTCPDPERVLPMLIHVTISRIKESIDLQEFQNLFNWVKEKRSVPIGTLRITHPILKATRDREGLVDHPAGTSELNLGGRRGQVAP